MITNSLRFEYSVCQEISKLGWCAILKENKPCQVICGENVEITTDAFVEGAWDGSYDDMKFELAELFCGSGGKICGGGYLFATPSHILDKLVSLRANGNLYVSNSVPFVLAITESKLDHEYTYYEKDFCSVIEGLDNCEKSIPLADGRSLDCHYYCNVYVDERLTLTSEPKSTLKLVENYEQYYESLLTSVSVLNKNANAINRKQTYGLVSTISSGYDAAACSAVAKQIGCNTALTFNAPEKYAIDSGEQIAEKLGYTNIITKNANDYLNRTDYVEADHVCSGELGTTIVFSAFENEFRNNIVFYGERGDKIWNKNDRKPNNRFDFTGELIAGISMAEYRLRVGFIMLPLPLYKAAVWESIHKISNSNEMQPWSVGGNYDRPIPRRIVEDCGVERHMFGQYKKGAGFNYHFDNLSYLKTRMSPYSFESFIGYYKKNKRKGRYRKLLGYYINELPYYMNYIMKKVGLKYRFKPNDKRINNPGAPSYLINWGMDVMCNRYLGGLEKYEKHTFTECRHQE